MPGINIIHKMAMLTGISTSMSRWASGRSLPQITLASRALPASRALLNEAQIMTYIAARWEVEVATTSFKGALFDSMNLMRHSDMFIGMHGAGWTNTLFLPSVRSHYFPMYRALPEIAVLQPSFYKGVIKKQPTDIL